MPREHGPSDAETRGIPIELRVERANGKGKIVGYAAVFDQLSLDLGGFREMIDRHAFDDTLDADIRSFWNHDSSYVLGRTGSGTLSVAVDEHGLKYEVEPPDTQWARDAIVSIGRGDVDQASFAFQATDDSWEKVDGVPIRTVLKARLIEVSPTPIGAYPTTSTALRSLELWKGGGEAPVPGRGGRVSGSVIRRLRLLEAITDEMGND